MFCVHCILKFRHFNQVLENTLISELTLTEKKRLFYFIFSYKIEFCIYGVFLKLYTYSNSIILYYIITYYYTLFINACKILFMKNKIYFFWVQFKLYFYKFVQKPLKKYFTVRMNIFFALTLTLPIRYCFWWSIIHLIIHN